MSTNNKGHAANVQDNMVTTIMKMTIGFAQNQNGKEGKDDNYNDKHDGHASKNTNEGNTTCHAKGNHNEESRIRGLLWKRMY